MGVYQHRFRDVAFTILVREHASGRYRVAAYETDSQYLNKSLNDQPSEEQGLAAMINLLEQRFGPTLPT